MNKFTETRLFLKIVSLLIASGMYIVVASDLLDNSKTIDAFLPTEATIEETKTDIPVVVNYDSDKFIISGIPETVDVTFKGTSSQLRVILNRDDYEVVAELGGISSEGTYNIPLQVTGLDNSGVTATIEPAEVQVTIESKVSEHLPVSLEVQGEDDLKASGYVVTDASLGITTAEVVGTNDVISQIATLQAVVNVVGRKDSFSQTVDIIAYDSNGEKVGSVNITPSTAEATVEIAEVGRTVASKEVPVTVETTGTARSGIFIESTEVSPDTVTIFGEENVLDNITGVVASVDLSAITESTEETVALTLPANVRAASPSKVTVAIYLEEEETRTFSNIPITTKNLPDDLNISFAESPTATVSVTAVPSVLDALTNDSIALFIDLSGLSAGAQSVSLQAEAISNAQIDTGNQKIKVELTEKNTEDETTNDGTTEDGATNGDATEDNTTEDETPENGTVDDNGETN